MTTGKEIKAILIGIIAIIVTGVMINGVHACFIKGKHSLRHRSAENSLVICDQDELWGNGVRETWTADNMAPGDEYTFDNHFVEIRGIVPGIKITCDYTVYGEPSRGRAFRRWRGTPNSDDMAKNMIITRCSYASTPWQIDCLADSFQTNGSAGEWCIDDIDSDGRLTFYDLKQDPLVNLPSPSGDNGGRARFEFSVKFDEAAGNQFQGQTFDLTMLYYADETGGPWQPGRRGKGVFRFW